MKRTIFRAVTMIAVVPALVAAQTQLTGAGATFPQPIYVKWFSEYAKAHPGVEINYGGGGSGAGIAQIIAGTVDFGGSDVGMNDQQLADFRAKRGRDILLLPTVLGAVVPVYNIPGVMAKLKFTGPLLADIYLGKITKWNDPAIAKINGGVKLPATDIVVTHRSDGSGTTGIFTDYLSKVSPEWKQRVGMNTSVNWPVGLGAAGNPGVAGLVKQTENSIGYVDVIYAIQNTISYGEVQNKDGVFLAASLSGMSAAAAGAAANMPDDFRVSIVNAPGKDSYPIASFTWLLVPTKFDDPAKRKVMTDFLKWMLTDAQKMTEALVYAPLPKNVADKELKALAKIQ